MSKTDETSRKISVDDGTTTTTNIPRSPKQQQGLGEGDNGDGLIHLPLHSLESILWQEERGRKLLPNINGDTTEHNYSSSRRNMQEITGVATHYVKVYVGTPAQKRLLAISTGADFAAFPCQVNNTQCSLILKYVTALA